MRDRLTFANVTSLVALFVALGGGAYALQKNSIGAREIETGGVKSKEVKDAALKGKDLKADTLTAGQIASGAIGSGELADGSVDGAAIIDGAVAGADVLDASLSGVDVDNNSITGADVNEGTLSGVDPAGPAGGDLQGSYPNPTLDEDSVGADELVVPPHAIVYGFKNDVDDGNVTRVELGSTESSSNMTVNTIDDEITPNVPGLYSITAFVTWESNPTGRRVVQIEVNDFLLVEEDGPASPDARTSQSVTTLIDLGTTDDVSFQVQQTSGGLLDTNPTGAPDPRLAMHWVGPSS